MISKAKLGSPEEHAVEGRAQHGRAHWDSCHHSQVCRPMMMIIISVTRRYRSDAGYWHSVTESSLALTLLMWPWWVRIPMEMMEMVKMMKMTVTISSCGGNLLMNIGPSSDGSIEPIFQERLRQVFSSSYICYISDIFCCNGSTSRIENWTDISGETETGISWISSIQPMHSIYNIYIARFCNRFAADGNMVGC